MKSGMVNEHVDNAALGPGEENHAISRRAFEFFSAFLPTSLQKVTIWPDERRRVFSFWAQKSAKT
jgi:hypothetical protein